VSSVYCEVWLTVAGTLSHKLLLLCMGFPVDDVVIPDETENWPLTGIHVGTPICIYIGSRLLVGYLHSVLAIVVQDYWPFCFFGAIVIVSHRCFVCIHHCTSIGH